MIYVKWIKDDSVGYVDSEKDVSKEWSWGNNCSCLTRKMYIDAEPNPNAGEAETSGWWYELPFAHYRKQPEQAPEEEKVYDLTIKGLCDDPYCPECGYQFWTEGDRSEIDAERCPNCHVRVNWKNWHRANDEEDDTDGSEENAQD